MIGRPPPPPPPRRHEFDLFSWSRHPQIVEFTLTSPKGCFSLPSLPLFVQYAQPLSLLSKRDEQARIFSYHSLFKGLNLEMVFHPFSLFFPFFLDTADANLIFPWQWESQLLSTPPSWKGGISSSPFFPFDLLHLSHRRGMGHPIVSPDVRGCRFFLFLSPGNVPEVFQTPGRGAF